VNSAEIVNAQLVAFNAHDMDSFAATYADGACVYRMPHAKLVCRGKAQLIENYGRAFKNEGLHAEVPARLVIGNKVIDHEKTWGLTPEPLEFVVYEVHESSLIHAVWLYQADQLSAPPADA